MTAAPKPFTGAMLYVTAPLGAPSASLNPGGKTGGPFAVVYLSGTSQVTSHDPADLDAIAAEFTRAAGMLREALAEAGKEARDE